MKAEYIFPTILIALEVCAAALSYSVKSDWRMAIYWLAAATLTAVSLIADKKGIITDKKEQKQ